MAARQQSRFSMTAHHEVMKDAKTHEEGQRKLMKNGGVMWGDGIEQVPCPSLIYRFPP